MLYKNDIVKEFKSENVADYINATTSELANSNAQFASLLSVDASTISTTGSDNGLIGNLGKIFQGYPAMANEWLSVYMNKVSLQKVSNKLWDGQFFGMFRKGRLGAGDSIEDSFYRPIQSTPYSKNTAGAMNYVDYTQKSPSVSFYTKNFHVQYIWTIYATRLIQACVTPTQLGNFLDGMNIAIQNGYRLDYRCMLKATLCKAILLGNAGKTVNLSAGYSNADFVEACRYHYMQMQDFTSNYNTAQVENFATDIQIMFDDATKAKLDVNVMADAFNMSKTDFYGNPMKWHAIAPTTLEQKRINQLISGDGTKANNYDNATAVFTSANLTALGRVKAVLLDPRFFEIWEVNGQSIQSEYDPYGKKYNQIWDIEEIWAVNPYAPVCVISEEEPTE